MKKILILILLLLLPMVGHALVAFIEIKYQAKINASMDY
jgi:uncharacterized protein YxeA